MPEAIILGSGTSNGIPMLGASYPPGYLDNPKNHRTRACLMLLGPEGNLLVDCPPEMRLQVTGAGIKDIDAVLITHTHADHVMGMDDLRSICIKTGRPIRVYTLPHYQQDLKRIFPYAFQEFPPGIYVPRFDLHDVPETLEICGMRVETFVVEHGSNKVVGLRVNNFAYITDVSYIPPEAESKLQGLDVLVMDAVRRKPHPNHFHLEKAIEVSMALKPKQTYFTHLSHDYDHDVTNSELPEGISLAFDGLHIPV